MLVEDSGGNIVTSATHDFSGSTTVPFSVPVGASPPVGVNQSISLSPPFSIDLGGGYSGNVSLNAEFFSAFDLSPNPASGVFIDSGLAVGNSYSLGLALGDVDGDGDMDSFIANWIQPNKVWLNTATALTGPDGDGDALPDNFEDGFGGTGIDVQAPEPVSSTGDASTGSTISAGDFRLSYPPGTEADTSTTEIEIRFEQDATGDGAPAVQISGVSLPTGMTKTVQMPFGNQTAVCIADVPEATIESLTAGECISLNIEIRIPADGGINLRSGYNVARVGDTATISGLANTTIFTITGLNTNGVEEFVDFEDFGPDDQGKRFGVDLDENYAGLEWAPPPPRVPKSVPGGVSRSRMRPLLGATILMGIRFRGQLSATTG